MRERFSHFETCPDYLSRVVLRYFFSYLRIPACCSILPTFICVFVCLFVFEGRQVFGELNALSHSDISSKQHGWENPFKIFQQLEIVNRCGMQ